MQKSNWFPSALIVTLQARAELLAKLRRFFSERNVLEVETPLLSHHTVTDPYVIGIPALFKANGAYEEKKVFLQTSPEYAMKRLLAAGSGPIFQISKAFRQGDIGRFHNPEFSLLEWYRPGFDHLQLMDEMNDLLQYLLNTPEALRISYRDIFQKNLGIDPHTISDDELKKILTEKINLVSPCHDRVVSLDLLFTHCIEPHLNNTENPVFLYDFPITHAALAKIRCEEVPPVASRFEVYYQGLELANGFHELQNAKEQRQRFEKDNLYRKQNNLPEVVIDERFLAALDSDFPDCSGVALGLDRLIMLALKAKSIKEVLSFDFEKA